MSAPVSDLVVRARAALEGITPGPWVAEEQASGGWWIEPRRCPTVAYGLDEPDARFVSDARSLVPELADELERWLAVVAEFRRRDASADRVIARLRREAEQLRHQAVDTDRAHRDEVLRLKHELMRERELRAAGVRP